MLRTTRSWRVFERVILNFLRPEWNLRRIKIFWLLQHTILRRVVFARKGGFGGGGGWGLGPVGRGSGWRSLKPLEERTHFSCFFPVLLNDLKIFRLLTSCCGWDLKAIEWNCKVKANTKQDGYVMCLMTKPEYYGDLACLIWINSTTSNSGADPLSRCLCGHLLLVIRLTSCLVWIEATIIRSHDCGIFRCFVWELRK